MSVVKFDVYVSVSGRSEKDPQEENCLLAFFLIGAFWKAINLNTLGNLQGKIENKSKKVILFWPSLADCWPDLET